MEVELKQFDGWREKEREKLVVTVPDFLKHQSTAVSTGWCVCVCQTRCVDEEKKESVASFTGATHTHRHKEQQPGRAESN